MMNEHLEPAELLHSGLPNPIAPYTDVECERILHGPLDNTHRRVFRRESSPLNPAAPWALDRELVSRECGRASVRAKAAVSISHRIEPHYDFRPLVGS